MAETEAAAPEGLPAEDARMVALSKGYSPEVFLALKTAKPAVPKPKMKVRESSA
jgi:hypothetical protein